jgi:metal-dependent amidase/aminoacylase/carboxypeptidase family protein
VIKDSVELEGDIRYIRYMTVETKETIEKEIRRIVRGIEEEFGVTCELTYAASRYHGWRYFCYFKLWSGGSDNRERRNTIPVIE